MAEIVPRPPSYDDEKRSPGDTVEKESISSGGEVTDAKMVKEVEAMEDRIQHDEATEDEYLVQNAYEVAVKVLSDIRPAHSFVYISTQVLSTRDDTELPCITVRMVFLSLGFSAFGA